MSFFNLGVVSVGKNPFDMVGGFVAGAAKAAADTAGDAVNAAAKAANDAGKVAGHVAGAAGKAAGDVLRMLLERQRMMRGRLLKALPVKLAKLPKVPLALLLARPKKREEWQRALLVW